MLNNLLLDFFFKCIATVRPTKCKKIYASESVVDVEVP